jgi:hypothetical protein
VAQPLNMSNEAAGWATSWRGLTALNGLIIDERAEAADCLSEKPVPTLSDRELFRPTTSLCPATGGWQAAPILQPARPQAGRDIAAAISGSRRDFPYPFWHIRNRTSVHPPFRRVGKSVMSRVNQRARQGEMRRH